MNFLNARVADIRARLPRAFATLVPGNLEIKRMAPEVEPGAPGAYGGAGTIDGKVHRQVLDQPAQHERVHDLQHADAHLSRVHPRPRVAGRIHVQTAAVPFAAGVQRLLGRLGAVLPSNWPTSSASTTTILSVGSAICSRSRSAPAGWSSTPGCTRSAGRVSRPSNGSRAPTARGRRSQRRSRSLLRLAGPGVWIQSGSQRDQPAAQQGAAGARDRFDFRKFNDAVVTGGGVPMLTLARIIERFIVDQR